MTTHTEAFAHFGVQPKNPRWSWSGISPDGKTVVLTFWFDEFIPRGGRYTGSCRVDHRPGSREWVKCLRWAAEHCDGRFGVIIATAKGGKERRELQDCRPTKLMMKITSIDLEAGTFTAVVMEEDFKLAA